MLGNAYLHATLRELPPKALGIILLHLPKAWVRLQYLAESERERGVTTGGIMKAVQTTEDKFARRFPDYSKWREFTEQQGQVGLVLSRQSLNMSRVEAAVI